MLSYIERELTASLRTLPLKHRVAFAASCSERLYPNYRAFAVVENWGDPMLLQNALDEVWSFLKGRALPAERIQALSDAMMKVVPRAENFTTLYAGWAENAAAAVIYALECCLEGDLQRAVWCASKPLETLDGYIDDVNNPNYGPHVMTESYEEWIWQSPLMVAELEKQRQDLEQLRAHPELDPEFLDQLRRSSSVLGIQPFRRGLVRDPDAKRGNQRGVRKPKGL